MHPILGFGHQGPDNLTSSTYWAKTNLCSDFLSSWSFDDLMTPPPPFFFLSAIRQKTLDRYNVMVGNGVF